MVVCIDALTNNQLQSIGRFKEQIELWIKTTFLGAVFEDKFDCTKKILVIKWALHILNWRIE